MIKPYHEMTAAERVAARIARNREIEQHSKQAPLRLSVDVIVQRLDRQKQRATYGAVAGVAGCIARGLMSGRAKSREYSWVVAATGTERGCPTGYTEGQIHPDCLRQIRSGQNNIIEDAETLRRWLAVNPA